MCLPIYYLPSQHLSLDVMLSLLTNKSLCLNRLLLSHFATLCIDIDGFHLILINLNLKMSLKGNMNMA